VTLDQQVTRQVAGIEIAERMNFSGPSVRRAQNIERNQCREQFHRRRRIARHVIVPVQYNLAAVGIPHMDAQ
jgi:predicted SprT family Zn-dependent metalloprotease